MDFRLKLFLQKILGFLPYGVYRFFVDQRPNILHPQHDANIKVHIKICSYVRPYGLNLRDKVIIETGTGGCLADPITFYLAGAAKTYTFDIRLHVNPKIVWGIIDHYENHLKYLSEVMGISVNKLYQRWEILKQIREREDFNKLLRVANIHLYESQIIPKEIKESSADIFFSNSVLHRISFNWLKKMIYDASKALVEDGIFWHEVSCHDINSTHDKRITRYHYLKYSDWFWKLITSEINNNQNRLRQSDFLKLFEEVGFKPVFLKSRRPKDYKEQLSRANPNKHFQNYDLDDLSITNFIIFAKRADAIKNKNIKPKFELEELPARFKHDAQ